jgi:hypothetical protein
MSPAIYAEARGARRIFLWTLIEWGKFFGLIKQLGAVANATRDGRIDRVVRKAGDRFVACH